MEARANVVPSTVGAPGWRHPLAHVEWVLDESRISRSSAGTAARAALGILFLVYGAVLVGSDVAHDSLQPEPLFLVVFSVFLFTNRLGSFGRYFVPITLGLYAYATATSYANELRLNVYYSLQIEGDRALTLGHGLPTVWLQHHLYSGRTGPLEVLAVCAYAGHFLIPFALVAILILTRRIASLQAFLFALVMTAVVATIIFVVAPTAPPWLADANGHIVGVHHVLQRALYDMHMSSIASAAGDGSRYDVTAALPSLHTAFAVLCLLAARHARLPRLVCAALAADVLAVVFSIVYTGEHYVIDAAAGAVLAVAAWRLVLRLGLRGADQPDSAAPTPSAGSSSTVSAN